MKHSRAILISILAALLTVSCSKSDKGVPQQLSTILRLNWIVTGSHSGEAVGATRFASTHGLNLDIIPGGQGADPLKLVGDNEFGIASADEILRANEKGASFVVIGVLNHDSPACFISKEGDSILAPVDLVGKTVGILPFGSTGLVFKSLLRRNNINSSDVTERIVSPDLRIFLSTDDYSVHPAFVYDETITLDQQGVSYNVLEPKNWGVQYVGPSYFCTRSTLENNPALVRAFVYTMCKGWNSALAQPDSAMSSLRVLSPDIDSVRELLVLKRATDYFQGFDNKPLNSDEEAWQAMIVDLLDFGVLQDNVNLSESLDLSIVRDFYGPDEIGD